MALPICMLHVLINLCIVKHVIGVFMEKKKHTRWLNLIICMNRNLRSWHLQSQQGWIRSKLTTGLLIKGNDTGSLLRTCNSWWLIQAIHTTTWKMFLPIPFPISPTQCSRKPFSCLSLLSTCKPLFIYI